MRPISLSATISPTSILSQPPLHLPNRITHAAHTPTRRGRFTQADTIVPNPGDPQSLNRYAYTRNNPVRYTDPSGHMFVDGDNDANYSCGNGPGQAACVGSLETPVHDAVYPEAYGSLAGYPVGTTSAEVEAVQQFNETYGPWAEAAVGLWEPADWGFTFNRWRQGDFSYWDLAGMLPLIPASGVRAFGKQVISHVDIIPTGQWHHVFSNKIMRQLNKHETLRGVFKRSDVVIQALNRESHIGYQKWHRAYDKEVVEWLKRNSAAASDEFIDFLTEIHARSDMRHRFPSALDALQALKTKFR